MGVHWREMDVALFCFLWLSIFSDCGYAAISRESSLSLGQTLSSPGESYELGFFSPNNSRNQYVGIWFKKIAPRVVVWVANREKPITSPAANLTISGNGSLILLDSRNKVVWSSNRGEPSTNKCHAKLLDTGNLVVVDEVSGTLLWQSFENLGDTMLPLSSLTYNLAANEKRVLTSWKSGTDPSPGEFSVELTPQVPSQLVTMKGNKVYKRSGPWDKTGFTGVPQMDESYASPFSLVQDVANGKGNFSYLQRNSQLLTRVIVTSEGYVKTSHYNGTGWVVDFVTPANKCDIYGACGPFGLCVTSTPIKCECIKGFVPKHKEEWKRGNKTSGCVRRKQLLSCHQEATKSSTDAFYRLSSVKPPDLYEYAASFADKDQCRQGCLGNCSCTAFAYITGIGCLLWNQELMDTVQYSAGGEFLSIRLASSELVWFCGKYLSAGSRRTMMIIAGSICLSIFVILAFASYKYWRYRAKRNAWKTGLEQEEISGLTFFEMNTVRAATDNFSISNKLGQGGFGPVYKGILSDKKEIAVKRLSSSSGQGTEEFMNEIKLISKLQHRNLVRLLGCCIDGEEKLLIYEFMVNKSLDSFLFDSTLKLQIDWPKRFNIIEGVARGLLYLHRDSCLKVIHRDMKVSNILLDENMNPKISDFGLARMFQGTQHQDSTLRVVGTIGYMSPEYAWTGMFSEKSDIYAFGVVLLEIISGMKISSFNCGKEGKTLLEYAWESWLETDGVDLLDQDIASSCSPVEVARCVQIGLLCIQQQAVDRPNIAQVVFMITTTTDLPRPKQPVFALQIHDQESTVSVLESGNHMTQTAIYGR
ncbi:PREDICTED: G-type lectin S-receptor-like serine/threonine-protein kinase At1g11280 isoform X1 [Brassica oleracea var. oleracea]|uniref:G-type lectin S-receptor-like serine/threonine-protein kinase At1g11280 isoform X1 n=1 Tax=Brassica oleracea var. oleracea TaxID=109376 RepID=UPI0006A6B031|nr:PREDICTED: G-type lectin S-receptor-like serine/threonine-protein kinase At1g11280 isoform X1 [Brassica oleracea var. oleracea]